MVTELLRSTRYTLGGVETPDELPRPRISAFYCGTQRCLPCNYMSQHRHIVQLNVELSLGCTSCISNPGDGKDVPFVAQFAEEHFPSLGDHKAGHTEAFHSATLVPVRPHHGTSPSLYSHCSSCQHSNRS